MTSLLHMTKVAVGCSQIETLRVRMAARALSGETYVVTRFRPKRDVELVGGSLYWIIKHQLVARQEIIGFVDDPDGRRVRIMLSDAVRLVRTQPKRAHQGWRYLPGRDAPPDLGDDEAMTMAALPPALAADLTALGLI